MLVLESSDVNEFAGWERYYNGYGDYGIFGLKKTFHKVYHPVVKSYHKTTHFVKHSAKVIKHNKKLQVGLAAAAVAAAAVATGGVSLPATLPSMSSIASGATTALAASKKFLVKTGAEVGKTLASASKEVAPALITQKLVKPKVASYSPTQAPVVNIPASGYAMQPVQAQYYQQRTSGGINKNIAIAAGAGILGITALLLLT